MTSNIINLNKVRKARAKAAKELLAEENRRRHGRSKADRDADEAQRRIDLARVDHARREPVAEEDLDPGSVS